MADYLRGDTVTWTGNDGQPVTGRIEEVEPGTMTRTADGLEITREGSEADPALYIHVGDAGHVVRLASEVRRVE